MSRRRFAAAGRAALRAAYSDSAFQQAREVAKQVITDDPELRAANTRMQIAAIVVAVRAIESIARDAVEAALREQGVGNSYTIADAKFAVIKKADKYARNMAVRYPTEFYFVRQAGWQGAHTILLNMSAKEQRVYVAACQAARQSINDTVYPAALKAARRVLSRFPWRNAVEGGVQLRTVEELEERQFHQLIFGGLSTGDILGFILCVLAIVVIIPVFAGLSVLAAGLIEAVSEGKGPKELQVAVNIIVVIVGICLAVLAIRAIYRRSNSRDGL